MADSQLPHLPLAREQPVNRRRMGQPPRVPRPADPQGHGRRLGGALERAAETAERSAPGFDPRLLLRLNVSGILPETLEAIPGVRVVAQQNKSIILAFFDENARREFAARLATLARGGEVTRKEILFATNEIDAILPADRMSPSLAEAIDEMAFPATFDVELWPLDRLPERDRMVAYFVRAANLHGVEVLDRMVCAVFVLFRVRATRPGIDWLLSMRDVRRVDVPPRMAFDRGQLLRTANEMPHVRQPPANAPTVGILDSGLVSGHPLLSPAVGDRTSEIPGVSSDDAHGHGTFVAGVVLHGDVAQAVTQAAIQADFWLLSARILDANCEFPTTLLPETVIDRAVRDLHSRHGCRVFNVSVENLADRYRPGEHVGLMAALLDDLARELGVLFVVPTGNLHDPFAYPGQWLTSYPSYLLDEAGGIVDPAPALNALTVGGLARYDATLTTAGTAGMIPIAHVDEPAPMTRAGPGACGAIKPELVWYAGNAFFDPTRNRLSAAVQLGEVSTSAAIATGALLRQDMGTSFAAPYVAHVAGRLLAAAPERSANQLRALIVANAAWPAAADQRLANAGTPSEERKRRERVLGYGAPDLGQALDSSESRATLIAEDEIAENVYHFYEVPIPEVFWAPPTRHTRRVTVALAHTPMVRRTRIAYKCSSFDFRVVLSPSLDALCEIFQRPESRDDQVAVKGECKGFAPGTATRRAGSVQRATWTIRQLSQQRWAGEKLFVVVERKVPSWAEGLVPIEPYALVVILEDHGDSAVQLYGQVQAQLQVRGRARPRVRT